MLLQLPEDVTSVSWNSVDFQPDEKIMAAHGVAVVNVPDPAWADLQWHGLTPWSDPNAPPKKGKGK